MILYRDEDFAARVKEITKGKLCDAVYDGVGQATFPASLDCLKPRGMFVSFGSASGKIAAFDIGILAQKGSLYAIRPTLATYTADPGQPPENGAIAAARRHRRRCPDRAARPTAALDDVVSVHQSLESRATTGSTVLTL